MGRDGIKIIEFDQDEDRSPVARAGEEKGMKIVEFDNDPRDDRKTVATARDIGQIKIVEFDDDRPSKGPSSPETPRAMVKPIKIKDFGAEAEAKRPSGTGAGGKIKIMEFD